uniref:Uncharacterized protein n=1 Tax=Arundo donax TaxID=35708 RepID=A0A0A9EIW4_ARUDO
MAAWQVLSVASPS